MNREMTGEHSLKLKTLAAAFGRSWEEVALEWAGRPLTQREIAEKWTVMAGSIRGDVRFSTQDVSAIVRLARRRTAAIDAPARLPELSEASR